MVEVEIRSPVYDETSGSVNWITRATVRASDRRIDVSGDETLVSVAIPVFCASTNRRLYAIEDPEVWARGLPSAYRSGDLVAVVVQDDDAPTCDPDHDDPGEPPRIPEPAGVAPEVASPAVA